MPFGEYGLLDMSLGCFILLRVMSGKIDRTNHGTLRPVRVPSLAVSPQIWGKVGSVPLFS